MPFVTNSAGRKLYVLRQVSTGAILNAQTTYPVAVDDAPIEGLDPDLEYLAINRDAIPEHDPRVFNLASAGAREEGQGGSPATWHITHTATRRDAAEIKVAINNREAIELERHLGSLEANKIIVLGMGILFSELAGLTLNGPQTALKNRILAMANKVAKNDQRARQLFDAVDAQQTPAIDEGWESPS